MTKSGVFIIVSSKQFTHIAFPLYTELDNIDRKIGKQELKNRHSHKLLIKLSSPN